ncbi:BBSome complex assembly protein BBS10-like [Saccoglossus kowalevskii]|uniref:Bardet-Biedl syndrome 10 protein-like n=1 Tax=Saccoglossus kowalevskii TaxID=10224 RepID=A0ABM0H053_SACKO|nr:PREDICTED: Bardet-Biedl syndrome 10 protein-like [Saccoglossus kowalevskii]
MEPVDLSTCVAISSSLEQILKGSFGPNALQCMITSASGNILISSDGATILKSLHLSHPVGRIVINSVLAHCKLTGSGAKTFILIVTEALRCMRCYCSQNLLKLSQAFYEIQTRILPNSIIPQLMENSTLIEIKNRSDMKKACINIVRTSMNGKLNQGALEILASLTTDLIFKNCKNTMNLHKNVLELIDNFDNFCVKAVGLPKCESRIVPGMLLEREFLVQSDVAKSLDESHKFIIMDCILGDEKPESQATFSFKHDEDFQNAYRHQSSSVQTFLHHCKRNNVQLIISTNRVSEMASFFCKTFGISVIHFVAMEAASHLARLSRIHMIHSIEELLSGDNIGDAKYCRLFSLGSKRYIHICLEGNNGDVHQAIVCAPIQGLCNQYYMAVLSSVKTIRMWLDGKTVPLSSDQLHQPTNISDTVSRNCYNTAACIAGGGYTELLLHKIFTEYSATVSNTLIKQACMILSKALLYIPMTLHENSNSIKSRHNSFLRLLPEIESKLRSRRVVGIDTMSGELWDNKDTIIVEPIVSKYLLLNNVLLLLQQLLRLNVIVGVTKIPDTDSDQSDD